MEKTAKYTLRLLYVFGCVVAFILGIYLFSTHPYFVIMSATIFVISFFIMMKTDHLWHMAFACALLAAGFCVNFIGQLIACILVFLLVVITNVPDMIGSIAEKAKNKKATP